MLRKVIHCAECVSANTKPHWGDREMGTAISCTNCSQLAGLIQKLVETPRSSKALSLCAAVLRAAVFIRRSCASIVIVLHVRAQPHVHNPNIPGPQHLIELVC